MCVADEPCTVNIIVTELDKLISSDVISYLSLRDRDNLKNELAKIIARIDNFSKVKD